MTKKRKPRSGTITHWVNTSDGRYTKLKLTRKTAMAIQCTECMGYETNPSECTSITCALYPFRTWTRVVKKGTHDEIPEE